MAFTKTVPPQLLFYAFIGCLSYFIAHFIIQDGSPHPEAFKGYLVFMITVTVMTGISKAINKLRKSLIPHKYQTIIDIESSETSEASPSQEKKPRISTSILKAIVIYTLLYCSLNCSLNCAAFTLSTMPSPQISTNTPLNAPLFNEIISQSRILEETTPKLPTTTTQQEEHRISLSMGRILSSLSINAYSVVLSKDGQTAFVSVVRSGAVKIVDISTPESANVVNSIKLLPVEYPFVGKILTLSPDGNTLFASNMHYLDIIDVSNIEAPVVLAGLEDKDITENLSTYAWKGFVFNYKTSMGVSNDMKTLFIGGLGLQVVDITDKRKPVFISTDSKKLERDNTLPTEIAVPSNQQRLYVANGTLNIFETTNPKNFKLLSNYSSKGISVTSVVPSKKSDAVFIIGKGPGEKGVTIFEKISVSNPSSPTQLESYNLNKTSGGESQTLAISSDENNAFILLKEDQYSGALGVLNLHKNNFRIEKDAVIGYLLTDLIISQDDSTVMIAAESFKIIELYISYPNKRVFSLTKNLISTLKPVSDVDIDSSILSADGKLLFLKRGSFYDDNAGMEIVNISDPQQPQTLSYYTGGKVLTEVKILENLKRAFMVYEESIDMLDISDLTNLKLLGTLNGPEDEKISHAQFSSDGKRAYIISRDFTNYQTLRVADLSNGFENAEYVFDEYLDFYAGKSLLTKNDDLLFLTGSKIAIYNVKDFKPALISSTSADPEGDDAAVFGAKFSQDEKHLFLYSLIGSIYSLRIYKVAEDLQSVYFLGDFPKTSSSGNGAENFISLSADEKTAYVSSSKGYLFAVNISNYSSPILHATYAIGNQTVLSGAFQISKDGQTIYVAQKNQLEVLSLVIPYTLYLDTESLQLGQKYSQPVALLKRNSLQEYEIMSQSYKFTKVSLFELKINPAKPAPEWNYLPFPYWMSFDRDNKVLTVEPKKQMHLGTYTLYSAFSTKIPQNAAFSSIKDTDFKQEDLITTLISLGYIDNQMFLTSSFGTYEDFIVTSQYLPYKQRIFEILQQYYFETFTTFDIFPSLDVTFADKISISTLSYNNIRVDIKLLDDTNSVKFVNKQYSSIKPIITNNKEQIILEGSKKDINNALQSLVINQETATACDATITVWDSLNPSITNTLTNVSRFFKINGSPVMKNPIQGQIDAENVYTGAFFTLNLANGTFIDDFTSDLNYRLTLEDESKDLPAWISFSNNTLKGTPPEEILLRSVKLKLIVNNEFKQVKESFVLHIKISSSFILKLLMKYSPYILTMIGLVVYANKIYNILGKKRYRYPKDFYLNVGEEIGTGNNIIPPIAFIEQERRESEIILKQLRQSVGKSGDLDLAKHFVNHESHRIDKLELVNKIGEALQGSKQRLPLYSQRSEMSRNIIHQIIFNKLTLCHLQTNSETRRVFLQVKENWTDLVDWDNNALCTVNEGRLQGLMRNSSNGYYSQMTDNLPLLKDAIEAYAFMNQHVDYLAIRAHVVVRERVGQNGLKEFFKVDLENVNFDNGYGINWKIENDKLHFYGTPEEKFENRSLVIQVTDLKHKILKEVWIIGACDKSNENGSDSFVKSESVMRGKGYEIY